MIIDARPERYKGDLAWDNLLALIQAYDPPDQEWQMLAEGPEGYGLKITRGAHQGAYYPDYGTSFYFDFRTVDDSGESDDRHALLDADGTTIIGIDPPL
jgi:hypothetical protein